MLSSLVQQMVSKPVMKVATQREAKCKCGQMRTRSPTTGKLNSYCADCKSKIRKEHYLANK